MPFRDTATVYVKELRDLLRDGHILIYSVALPAFLYPVMILGVFQVVQYVKGIDDARMSRVEVVDSVTGGELAELLSDKEWRVSASVSQSLGEEEEIRRRLSGKSTDRSTDVVLALTLPGSDEGKPAGVDATLFFSTANDASVTAKRRVHAALDDYRRSVLLRHAEELGQKESFLDALQVDDVSLSTSEELANHILALVLPMLMIFMIALGAFYPSLDVTVGEKERGTLETTLLAPIGRLAMVTGKYGAVTTVSFVSFALNFAGMYLTLSHLQQQQQLATGSFTLGALAVVLVGALLVAAFFSAGMMLCAFLARSFKEGQGYVSVIYLVSLAPVAVLVDPQIHLDLPLSFIPIVNIALLFRDAFEGRLDGLAAITTLIMSALLAAAALWLAARVLGREDVATGGEVKILDLFRRRRGSRTNESSA